MARRKGLDDFAPARRATRRRRDVWFFTEGTLTEPGYLDFLHSVLPPGSPNVIHIDDDRRTHGGTRGPHNSSGKHPADLVARATVKKRQLDQDARRAQLKQELWPVVWCVFDHDNRPDTDAIIARATDAGLRIAFSNPCFEFWRLLHHQDYTATFSGVCAEADDRLAARLARNGAAPRDIKLVEPSQLATRFVAAKARAQRIAVTHADGTAPSKRDPYTDVWMLVDSLGIEDY